MSERHHYTQFFGKQRKDMLKFQGIMYEAVKTITDDKGIEIYLCRADNRSWKMIDDFPNCIFTIDEKELPCSS